MRSCYSTFMRFYDDPTLLTRVRYYFVPPDTPFVPYPNPFVSSNWDYNQDGYSGKGEVWPPKRTWASGAKVGDALAIAGEVCGDAEQWHNGLAAPPAVPVAVDLFGTPLCCHRLEVPFIGAFCINAKRSWSRYILTVDPVLNHVCADCANSAGTFVADYVGACTWDTPEYVLCGQVTRWRIILDGPGRITVTQLMVGLNVIAYEADGWDALSPIVVPLDPASSYSHCRYPSEVTVAPP